MYIDHHGQRSLGGVGHWVGQQIADYANVAAYMDRIGARELVTQDRMARVLKMRRKDPRTAAFFRLTGLEMKMKQYEDGERFILGVERLAGFSALDQAWQGPDSLPNLAEIGNPERWLARVG